jgi:hypothetical protein
MCRKGLTEYGERVCFVLFGIMGLRRKFGAYCKNCTVLSVREYMIFSMSVSSKSPDFLQQYYYLQERPLYFLLKPLNILYTHLKKQLYLDSYQYREQIPING